MWSDIENWWRSKGGRRIEFGWRAYEIGSGLLTGLAVLFGWLDKTPWAIAIAVVTATATILCVRILLEPDIMSGLWRKIKSAFGSKSDEAPKTSATPVGTTTTAIARTESASDHLARLWLYEKQLPAFESSLEQAMAASATMQELFEKSMNSELSNDEYGKLNNAEFEFIEGLDSADAIFERCFKVNENMSMTNPYRPSTMPIRDIDRVPGDLQHRFRKLHDRLNSVAQNREDMTNNFQLVIMETKGAIQRAADKAIEAEIERTRRQV